ncbi:Glucokinase [Symmachiella macrocystis]|uniref:Glucokinase n=1 Tax=Symmachiella macrocystis TaxID=2527985 RepID=A0A5C6B5J2_9PLAN|nr:ROK family protein [Symmachiella macrocystis]TWU07027.1 Glucokinase [Symmachiella macrocystis]
MRPNPDHGPFYLGVDVGGTNIKVGVVDSQAYSLSHVSRPTKPKLGPEVGLQTICEASRMAIEQSQLEISEIHAVGLATPGTMDIPNGLLLDPPNLPGWTNLPLRDQLSEELGLPTTLQNDANAAAYGEFWGGMARDASSLVFFTLGTGIGCGIIIGDTIVEGAHSHGAECGHIIIEMNNGRLCPTGQFGTLEAYASAKSVVKRCREALDDGRESPITAELEKGEKLTPLLISRMCDNGDELAEELIMQTARYLGVGTTTLMHTINPEMVLFGGAMTFGRNETELGRRFLQEIRNEVKKRAFPVPAEKTQIEYASLGGDAGYIGAAGCARLKFP